MRLQLHCSVSLQPLKSGAYGLVFHRDRVCLCHGLSSLSISFEWAANILSLGCLVRDVYKRSGGKAGKHGWADEATSISAVSNVAAKIYEPIAVGTRHPNKYFCIIPATSPLTPHAVTLHALLPSHIFLVMLTYPVRVQGASIALAVGDSYYLEALTGREKDLLSAIKVIVGHKQNIEEVLGEEDD